MDSGTARDGRPPVVPNDAARIRRILPLPFLMAWLLCPLVVAQGTPAADPGQDQDVQVLTRGPVHEAFALPVVHDPRPGLTVPKQPPAPVEEMPPDQKPAGQNVQWIPATGAGTPAARTSSGSAASGASRRRAGNGCRATGTRWTRDISGCRATGCPWPRNRAEGPGRGGFPGSGRLICRRLRRASRPGRAAPPRGPASSGRPEAGTGKTLGSSGAPGSGRPSSRAGCGSRRTTCGLPGDTCSSRATGTCPWPAEASSSPRSIIAQPVYLRPAYVVLAVDHLLASGLVTSLFVQPSYHQYCFGDYYDRAFLSVGIFPWFSFHIFLGARGAGLSRPPVHVLCGNLRPAGPEVGRGGCRRIHRAAKRRVDEASAYLRRANPDRRAERLDHEECDRGREGTRTGLGDGPADPPTRQPSGSRGGDAIRAGQCRGRGQWQRRGTAARFRQERSRQERNQQPGVPKGGRESPPRPAARPAPAPWHSPRRPSRPPSISTRGPESRSDRGSTEITRPAIPGVRRRLAFARGIGHAPLTTGGWLRGDATRFSIARGLPFPLPVMPPIPLRRRSVVVSSLRCRGIEQHSTEAPRLDEQPQFTHRQPPPPPRPLHQKAHQPGPQKP